MAEQLQEFALQIPENYKPVRIIAKGAFGVVLEAVNTKDNTRVAIKKIPLPPSMHPDAEQWTNVLREVLLAMHLQHPHVRDLLRSSLN